MYKLKYKIWLDQSGKVFGQGPYNLLAGIKRTGSLAQAAKAQNMSYSQAHSMMKKLSQKLGFPLLISKSGGASGGETKITTEAQELLELYKEFSEACDMAINSIYYDFFINNNEITNENNLLNAFNIGRQGIIALVGGGGKTTLMWKLAKELAAKNKKVAVCTTTHIFLPEQETDHLIITDDLNTVIRDLEKKLKKGEIVTIGRSIELEKLVGVSTTWIDSIADYVDYILVEADGAKGKPLKAPASHEPVIPYCVNTVISVVGIDALGKVLNEDTAHRSHLISEISGTPIGQPITVETIVSTLISDVGGHKSVPKHADWLVCINKVDTLSLQQDADMIAKHILAKKPFIRIIATSREVENMVVAQWQN